MIFAPTQPKAPTTVESVRMTAGCPSCGRDVQWSGSCADTGGGTAWVIGCDCNPDAPGVTPYALAELAMIDNRNLQVANSAAMHRNVARCGPWDPRTDGIQSTGAA